MLVHMLLLEVKYMPTQPAKKPYKKKCGKVIVGSKELI